MPITAITLIAHINKRHPNVLLLFQSHLLKVIFLVAKKKAKVKFIFDNRSYVFIKACVG